MLARCTSSTLRSTGLLRLLLVSILGRVVRPERQVHLGVSGERSAAHQIAGENFGMKNSVKLVAGAALVSSYGKVAAQDGNAG